MKATRRTFLKNFTLLTAFSNFIIACKASTTSSSGAACMVSGASATVNSNHGHIISSIPWADIDLAVQQTYTVNSGTAGHTHTVTVSASDMASMKSGSAIVVKTTDPDSNGHTHNISFVCTH